ncbi:hypothetical protein L0F51_04125 [Afifella sp. H1R]|uniref:hypothetical protein n=1 Tax=Afifella sp. H1R TaxID=2908841 RepID=UPI001F3552D1|nr:hypothetical protein [Afifella sp. H1R]MCF1502952.1 hypothetical protein [Afifella sp. H1R]
MPQYPDKLALKVHVQRAGEIDPATETLVVSFVDRRRGLTNLRLHVDTAAELAGILQTRIKQHLRERPFSSDLGDKALMHLEKLWSRRGFPTGIWFEVCTAWNALEIGDQVAAISGAETWMRSIDEAGHDRTTLAAYLKSFGQPADYAAAQLRASEMQAALDRRKAEAATTTQAAPGSFVLSITRMAATAPLIRQLGPILARGLTHLRRAWR